MLTWAIACSLGLAAASARGAGTASAQFLKLGAGARPAGMGEAFTAVADDLTAAYWNPAGLVQISAPQIGIMHNNYLLESDYQYAGGAWRTGPSAFAVSVYRLDFGTIDGYSNSDVKTGHFDAASTAAGLSWARAMSDRFSVGGTVEYLQEAVENESATGVAGDVGILYRHEAATFGLVIQHMGSKLKFVREEENLPRTIRLGASKRFLENKITSAVDYSLPNDNDGTVALGAEYRPLTRYAFRLGYRSTPGNDIHVDGLTGVTAGLGIFWGRLGIDYAFVPFGDLGDTHRVSLIYTFHQ